MYRGIQETKNLRYGQLALCKCPEWCDTGFQVAIWKGDGFKVENDGGIFNDCVIEFLPLNEDGEPLG
jgi:hypothetical protein